MPRLPWSVSIPQMPEEEVMVPKGKFTGSRDICKFVEENELVTLNLEDDC